MFVVKEKEIMQKQCGEEMVWAAAAVSLSGGMIACPSWTGIAELVPKGGLGWVLARSPGVPYCWKDIFIIQPNHFSLL